MSAYHSVPRGEHQHQPIAGEPEFGSSNINASSSSDMRNPHRFSAPSSGEQSFRVSSLASSSRRRSSNRSSVGSSLYNNAGNNSGSISMLTYSSRDWSNRDFSLSQQQLQPGPPSPRQEQRSSGVSTTFSGSRYYHGTDGGTPFPILEVSNSTSMSSGNSWGTSGSLNVKQQPQQQQSEPPSFRQQQQQTYARSSSLHVPPPTSMSPRHSSDRYASGPPPVSPDQRRRMTMMEPPVFQQQNRGGGGNGMMMFRGDDLYSRRSMNSAHYQSHNHHHLPQQHLPYPPSPRHHHHQHDRYQEVPSSPQRGIRVGPSVPAPISNYRGADLYALSSKIPSITELPPPSPPQPPPRFRTVEPTMVETSVVSLRQRHSKNNSKPFYFEMEQGTTLETTTAPATENGTTATGNGGASSDIGGGRNSSSSGDVDAPSRKGSNNDSHKHQVQCFQCQVRLLVSKDAVCVQCPSCHAVSAATNVISFGRSSCVLTRSAAAAAAAAVPAV